MILIYYFKHTIQYSSFICKQEKGFFCIVSRVKEVINSVNNIFILMKKRKIQNLQSAQSHSQQIPQQLSFLTYEQQVDKIIKSFPYSSPKHQAILNQKQNPVPEQFTQEQRQNLKNAFRYISRLAFKQSKNYPRFIQSLIKKYKNEDKNRRIVQDQIKMMLDDAEMISGERYFKKYLENIDIKDQLIVIEYMIWFLKLKYLRYLKKTEAQKGKRKIMKKQLYLRFKNQVMLPYLQNLLHLKAN